MQERKTKLQILARVYEEARPGISFIEWLAEKAYNYDSMKQELATTKMSLEIAREMAHDNLDMALEAQTFVQTAPTRDLYKNMYTGNIRFTILEGIDNTSEFIKRRYYLVESQEQPTPDPEEDEDEDEEEMEDYLPF